MGLNWFLNQRNKRNDKNGVWEAIDKLEAKEKVVNLFHLSLLPKKCYLAKTSGKINSVGRKHVPYEIEGKLGDSLFGYGSCD